MLNLSFYTALFLITLTGFLWGSWYTFVKVIDHELLPMFVFWMYVFSNVIVWAVVFLGKTVLIPGGVLSELERHGSYIPGILLLGAIFGINIQLTLHMMGRLGIIFTISISSSFGILGGTLVSALIGGLPENVSLLSLMAVAGVLLLATVICQLARSARDQEQRKEEIETVKANSRDRLLYVLNVILGLAFTVATNLYCKTTTNPDGMAPMLFCGFLGAGAMLGTFVTTLVRMWRIGKWREMFTPSGRMLRYAAVASVCHFGGDIVYMLAAPSISMSIAWPLTTTSNLWGYLWGIIAGEYRNCGRKAKLLLIAGIMMFIAGVLGMSRIMY